MTIEQINSLEIDERIKELKKRRTDAPNVEELKKDWDENLHDVMSTEVRKKRKVMVEDEIRDERGVLTKPARYEEKDVNRIALPLEQDITNIHTAFTVGIEPKNKLVTEGEDAEQFFDVIKNILRQSKIKFVNKKVVRSWLSEQEVAEYWYTVEDIKWWRKILNKISPSAFPTRKLKSAVWSPFRGDKLYPYFNNEGDLIAFSREYKDSEGKTKFMTIDKEFVRIYVDNEIEQEFKHLFKKIPIIYMYRSAPYCAKIRTIRDRLETLLSNYADCLDYNFFPKLAARGIVEGIMGRDTGSEIIQLENGADISYLTWSQSPEMAKVEFDNLTERAYSMTNTPRISFENLQGMGNAFSGVSFKFAFMGAHMAVSNHAETVEEYLQRRLNFLISAVGSIYPKYEALADEIEIETEIVPFMIDNRASNIDDAVKAVSGGVASIPQGIIMAGITDNISEELELIEQEKAKAKEEFAYPIGI